MIIRWLKLLKNLKPSARGEIEITDLNRVYLERGQLKAKVFSRGVAWLDAGTHESLASSGIIHSDDPGTTGTDDLLPGGDCLSHGLHHERAIVRIREGDGWELVWRVFAGVSSITGSFFLEFTMSDIFHFRKAIISNGNEPFLLKM